jgi:hypothetical protein
MVLPLALMAVVVVGTGHNLWPRFFFFGAAFLVQWAVRGGHVVVGLLPRPLGKRLATGGLLALTLGSLVLLPRAWAPKQDHEGARDWLVANTAPTDAVVGTGMLELPMNQWLGLGWPVVEDAETLRTVEQTHDRTWVVYTFPIRLRTLHPDLWARLEAEYGAAHVLPGTVGGGDIVILTRPAPRPGRERSP